MDLDRPIFSAGSGRNFSREAVLAVAKMIAAALALALIMRTFIFQPFSIPSPSMEGTLLTGDYIFVSKFSYGFSRYSLPFSDSIPAFGRFLSGVPQRGDVAVFRLPVDPSQDYVKRVIGLPGDKISISRGVVAINGVEVSQSAAGYSDIQCADGVRTVPVFLETLPGGRSHLIAQCNPMTPLNEVREFIVPPGHYFMLGDNRDNSRDSRVSPASGGVGFVPAENLVGKAQAVFFSTNGTAGALEFWRWPSAIRFGRLFHAVR
jgi:signal peptidase I